MAMEYKEGALASEVCRWPRTTNSDDEHHCAVLLGRRPAAIATVDHPYLYPPRDAHPDATFYFLAQSLTARLDIRQ